MRSLELASISPVCDVCNAVVSTYDLPDVLSLIVKTATDTMGVKGSSLRLLDRERRILEMAAAYGLSGEYLAKGARRGGREPPRSGRPGGQRGHGPRRGHRWPLLVSGGGEARGDLLGALRPVEHRGSGPGRAARVHGRSVRLYRGRDQAALHPRLPRGNSHRERSVAQPSAAAVRRPHERRVDLVRLRRARQDSVALPPKGCLGSATLYGIMSPSDARPSSPHTVTWASARRETR